MWLAIFFSLSETKKDWEATFLFSVFGLLKELSTNVGFAFSNNGSKAQDLRLRMKKVI